MGLPQPSHEQPPAWQKTHCGQEPGLDRQMRYLPQHPGITVHTVYGDLGTPYMVQAPGARLSIRGALSCTVA